MTTTKELIARLRTYRQPCDQTMLHKAADALEYLQAENARLKEEEHESQLHLERALRAKDAALAGFHRSREC